MESTHWGYEREPPWRWWATCVCRDRAVWPDRPPWTECCLQVSWDPPPLVSPQTHAPTQDVWLTRGHEGKTKVFVTLRQGKKKNQWNIHPLSLALTLTLTATLSPNHYTTSNFGRPCTQFRLTGPSQDTMLPKNFPDDLTQHTGH